MKKSYLWAGQIIVLAAAHAHAQSSVTLYGVIDTGINYTNSAQTGRNPDGSLNSGSQINMTDGATRSYGSRWGLRGSENLGGGLSAIFTLENGYNIANGALGQGGAMFGRQAYVGLNSDMLGVVTIGRQYDTQADFVSNYSVFSVAALSGTTPGDVDGLGHTRRVNNAIKYVSPTYRGFTFGGMYSPGGKAGDFTGNQIWALGASYEFRGFSAGAGYINARDPNLSSFGDNPNSGGAGTNNMGSVGSLTSAQSNPIYAGYASARTFEIYSAGASYKFGKAALAASFSHTSFGNLGDLDAGPNPFDYSGTAIFNTATATVSCFATPTLQLGGGYTYTHGGGAGGNGSASYHQGIFSVQYFLSKRTEVYFYGVYQLASGTDSLGQPAVANIDLMTPSSTNHQFVGRVGIVQRF
ncbi:gram-negative porin family protein [Paraburkholderia xenovorans LB400]|uniref:Outer membrane porin, OmpC family n=1 Tax=Paraburkholderia xenovorans (strain LB400) TaxID=266265 RepID=Q13G89_PARXL|nr:porin [Paraburkholderia xenovorans]ABE36900.1 outer membrane porin, OmpC family [Paraburkholderia xenovorans LB400]AIP34807.1 gram-negative porin family protein [Paraburkholderia xenovorans LB400]